MTTASRRARDRGRRFGLPAMIAAGGLLAVLAGCSANSRIDPFTTASVVADDYQITHPITNQERTATLDIPVSAYAARLTDGERDNIDFFAQGFHTSGAALIGVAQPSGSRNQAAARRIAAEIIGTLRADGVPAAAIRRATYAADSGDPVAPVRLAFREVVAATTPCGSWPDLVTETGQNRHYENYGCAEQQDLAAMVENPLDLEYPRGLTPPDAARRADVLQKYRTGSPTGAQTNETGGTISQGGGQ